MDSNYLCVLSFLKKYSGNQYKKLEKCATEEERTYMINGSESGKAARTSFASLVEAIETKHGFEHDRITQWQNSGTFVSYFWCQMKRPDNKASQISLSLFAEKVGVSCRFRVSIELAMEKATKEDALAYSHLLDIPLDSKLVYVSGGNNESEFRGLSERDNAAVKRLGLKKVQVSYIYNEDQYTDDNGLVTALVDAAGLLVPYYDSLFGKFRKIPASPVGSKEKEGKESVPVSTKEAITQIKDYIAARGFSYPDGLIENFFLSLKSKPFVILAGTSGTGKTRLVKMFAEAIGADYKLVSVRPDWSDGSDLFGHYDLNSKFIEGPVCSAFDAAISKPKEPVLLCLDEMNLARVEYYLSDFLSVIESREKMTDGTILTSEIAQYKNGIPDNLYIVGTVNMDETTFPFSKKVLDRANTIEFSYVDLMPSFGAATGTQALSLPNSYLRTEYLVLARDCATDAEYIDEICSELQQINEILLKANAHIGYRVRDEIVFYMLNNKKEGNLLTHQQALDNEIMQKILPRIQGSSESVREMLCELFKQCAVDYSQKTGDSDSEKMRKILDDQSITCKYRRSAEKLELMVRRFEEDGFTSYWL